MRCFILHHFDENKSAESDNMFASFPFDFDLILFTFAEVMVLTGRAGQ